MDTFNDEDDEIRYHSITINDSNLNASSNVPKYRYSSSLKNQVLENLDHQTFSETSLEYDIPVSTLQSWKRSRDESTFISFDIVKDVVSSVVVEGSVVKKSSMNRHLVFVDLLIINIELKRKG